MIADRSNPVRTVSRTKWATCPEGTKSWIDGGSSQTWSTSQARNVLLIPRLNHDAPSSSRKIRLLGQAPSVEYLTWFRLADDQIALKCCPPDFECEVPIFGSFRNDIVISG